MWTLVTLAKTELLIWNRFCWLKMQVDVTHLVAKVCSCVKRTTHSSCCTHADIIFSSTIRVNWFRLLPSWHMQWWLPVFASVNWPFLKVCPGIYNNKNCSRPVIQWLHAEVWSTMKDSQWPGKRIWEQTIFPTIKVLWYPLTQDHKLPPIDQWQTERMNHTILAMLKTLPEHYKTQWKNHVTKLVHAYNCTKYSSTGYSPYYLMFGRVPRLPTD